MDKFNKWRLQLSLNLVSILFYGYFIFLLFSSIPYDGDLRLRFNVWNEIWIDLGILNFIIILFIYLFIEGVKNSEKI